jgi:valyl-tRNA synthetase
MRCVVCVCVWLPHTQKFVEKVWEWKQEYGNRITSQLRFLGASVDWSREAFTMDAQLSKAVKEAFVRFHKDGLVFRDNRLVNWSCYLNTAISEIEVEYLELKGRTMMPVPNHTGPPGKNDASWKYEFGVITSFSYPVEDSTEQLTVATTRLETMLGDTAVAIHPDDPRYTHLHGKHVVHPFTGKRIPIVLDKVLVDMEKGTGAVKITPAHDPNDFLCGQRHGLEFVSVIDEKGRINDNGGEFAGLMRYDARKAVEERLKDMGLYVEKKDNPMSLGTCSRSGDIIEPLLKPQWWVNCKSMAARSVEAVKKKELKIIPEFQEVKW